jgi:hypothetical protein
LYAAKSLQRHILVIFDRPKSAVDQQPGKHISGSVASMCNAKHRPDSKTALYGNRSQPISARAESTGTACSEQSP